MTLFLQGQPLTPEADTGQQRLSQAHRAGIRVECRCRVPAPELYIAKTMGSFIVKRMPGTGPDHAMSCPLFLPPEELSGLAQVQTAAIVENPDDGTTTLKLGFPLRKNGTSTRAPERTDSEPTEVKTTPRHLTLTSLLHFLWHDAELNKWYPAMEGKRFWGVVQSALRRAAADKVVKGQDLSRILYVPEYFKPDQKTEIASRRGQLFVNLRPSSGKATPYGLVIAEFKAVEPTAHGARFLFKHAPDCAFFADTELAEKFERIFGERLQTLEAIGSGHAIVIASFSLAKAGYPVLQEIGMMLVSENWIPCETLRELELLSALTAERRAFQKQMRFNLAKDAPIASAVLLDTPNPVALFVADNDTYVKYIKDLASNTDTRRFDIWQWTVGDPMPAFPVKRAVSSGETGLEPEENRSLHHGEKGVAQATHLRMDAGGYAEPNNPYAKPQTFGGSGS